MFPTRSRRFTVLAASLCLLAASLAHAQLRVATWNVSNYGGGRTADIQTVVYGVFQDRSMSPDVIITEEFTSSAAVTAFRSALNTATGSPGDWVAATFIAGPDTNSAFFYRSSKVTMLGSPVVISQGGNSPSPPRNTVRYAVRLGGYSSDKAVLCCYSTHMKAGTAPDDLARRLTEAQRIRANAETLNANYGFLVAGDFNIQSGIESAYQELVASQANNTGRFYDPIATPGDWHDTSTLRFVHTQDPIAANGGMDDRYDQVLVSGNLVDGGGFDYLGDPTIPYSTSTWNDVNHSYRAWGNDGTSFNLGLTTTDNTMVGPAIAQAIINVATTAGGHIPVFLDFVVPPVIGSDATLSFGQVQQGALAEQTLAVWNNGNVVLWTAAGIADLHYTLTASTGFSVPGGTFTAQAGVAHDQRVITMDTTTLGPLNGTLIIASDAPDEPSRVVTLTGEVIPGAGLKGDLNCDGHVNFADINPFVLALTGQAAYEGQYPNCSWLNGDCNDDGTVSFADINPFVALLTGP